MKNENYEILIKKIEEKIKNYFLNLLTSIDVIAINAISNIRIGLAVSYLDNPPTAPSEWPW